MNLSSRGRYATRAMIELARQQKEHPVPLSAIASCQSISRKYLQQLMASLRNAGIVRVFKGNKGGFKLGKPVDQITVKDILFAVEGALDIVECVGQEGICERSSECESRTIWANASLAMTDYLGSITLSMILKGQYKI